MSGDRSQGVLMLQYWFALEATASSPRLLQLKVIAGGLSLLAVSGLKGWELCDGGTVLLRLVCSTSPYFPWFPAYVAIWQHGSRFVVHTRVFMINHTCASVTDSLGATRAQPQAFRSSAPTGGTIARRLGAERSIIIEPTMRPLVKLIQRL